MMYMYVNNKMFQETTQFLYVNMYFVYPRSTKEFTRTRSEMSLHFKIELEFETVAFWGEGKTGVPEEKPLEAE